MAVVICLWLYIFAPLCSTRSAAGNYIVPDLPKKRAFADGNINIGVILPITKHHETKLCGDELQDLESFLLSISVDLGVAFVNQRLVLPGNRKLGYVILDDCHKTNVATLQCLSFTTSSACYAVTEAIPDDVLRTYQVVAVMGAMPSIRTFHVASMLSSYEVPFVSILATSPIFSSEYKYQSFVRTVPSDESLFIALRAVCWKLGWTYFSLVYQLDDNGRRTADVVKSLFNEPTGCLSSGYAVPVLLEPTMATEVIKNIMQNGKGQGTGHAVLLLTSLTNVEILLKTAATMEKKKTFLWIVCEMWENGVIKLETLDQVFDGTLFFRLNFSTNAREVAAHMRNVMTGKVRLNNDWYQESMNTFFRESNSTEFIESHVPFHSGLMVDTISLLAKAIAQILQGPNCKNQQFRNSDGCIHSTLLLDELRASRHDGHTGWLQLNRKGDRLGHYVLKQVLHSPYHNRNIIVDLAEFNSQNRQIMLLNKVSWAHLNISENEPTFFCSKPCTDGVAIKEPDTICCWDCIRCKANEIVNNKRCEQCPKFQWPDNDSKCQRITPTVPGFKTNSWIVNVIVSATGIVLCLVVGFLYYHLRKTHAIRNSNLSLSFTMLIGMIAGYIALVLVVLPPTEVICRVTPALIGFTFTSVYASLLVRVWRSYRFFLAGMKNQAAPNLLGELHQFLYVFTFVLVQIVAFITPSEFYDLAWAGMKQESREVNSVELNCVPPNYLILYLYVYDFALLLACLSVSFLTRGLQDNHGECSFIFRICCCCFILWLICFSTLGLFPDSSLIKNIMGVMVIALSHLTVLVLVFGTRIYAALYVVEEEQYEIEGKSAPTTPPGYNSWDVSASYGTSTCITPTFENSVSSSSEASKEKKSSSSTTSFEFEYTAPPEKLKSKLTTLEEKEEETEEEAVEEVFPDNDSDTDFEQCDLATVISQWHLIQSNQYDKQ